MIAWLHQPIVRGALAGWAAAVTVDLQVFLRARSWREFFAVFEWDTATKRWVNGAVTGALFNAGLGYLIS